MNQNRYHRQTLVKSFGESGQQLLKDAHAVIIGCGGLGSNSANLLTRMGIGTLDLIDNDTIDLTNLHRTVIYTEADIGKLKSETLANRLRLINHDVAIYDHHITVTADNISTLLNGATIVLDGTDNIDLRRHINTAALEQHIPWVYAGVYETTGMVLGIIPGQTACFQCLAATLPTTKPTATIPVHGYLPSLTAALQVAETLRLLQQQPPSGLLIYDADHQRCETLDIKRNPKCPSCARSK